MTTSTTATYTGLRPMGRTGATTSLAGWSDTLDTSVVIKQFSVDGGWAGMADLLNELDAWFALQGTSLAAPIEAGVAPDGQVFVARAFVAGQPLLNWARHQPRPSRAELLSVLADAAAGLSEIHRAGLAHGAVSPNNIIVTSDGAFRRAVLTDPRPAALTGVTDASGRTLPQAHQPPDTRTGGPTAAGDVYSLASTACELLVGHPVPPQVELALSQALFSDPERRPSAATLSETLAMGAAAPTPAPRPGPDTTGAMNTAPTATPTTAPSPASRPGQSSAAPLADLATELEALRGSILVTGPRRRGAPVVALAAVALIALIAGGSGWILAHRTSVENTPVSPIADAGDLEIAVQTFAPTVDPATRNVDVILELTVTNRQTERRSCPSDACAPALVLGRLGGDPGAGSSDSTSTDISIDPRELGVRTSPRRGSITLVRMNIPGVSLADLPRDGATPPWSAIATIPDGTEVLGVAITDSDDRLIGFAAAQGWPNVGD